MDKKMNKETHFEKYKNLTLTFHFNKKAMKLLNEKMDYKKIKKFKTYHQKLLESFVENTLTRGKMVKYADYNAYNSDDSDSIDESNDTFLHHYGFGSIFANSTNCKSLPKWREVKAADRKALKKITWYVV